MADLSKLTDEELLALSEKHKAKSDLSQLTDEELSALVRKPQWTDLPGNIIPSAGQALKDFGQVVAHPLDTAASILEVGAGAISQFFPDVFEGSTLQEAEAKAKMVGEAMVNRYGGGSFDEVKSNIKNTMITDPTGFAMDIAGLLGGGATLAGKAGLMSANTVGKVNKYANMVDPLALSANVIKVGANVASKAPAAAAGLLSGLGQGAVNELYQSGKAGGMSKQVAVANMRSPDGANADDILKWAKDGVKKLKQTRGDEYRSGMVDISNDASILDFQKIDDAFSNILDDNTFKGVPKSPAKARALEEIGSEIDQWRNLGPDYWTPEGMDTLKQRIGDLTDWNNKDRASNQAYLEMYDSIRGEIANQAPTYGKIMGDYSDATKQIKELEKTLSIKDTSSADTTFRKLTSALRNNVNTNFGQRAELVGKLEDASGQPLKAAISGQAASSIAPRGIQGLGATGNILQAASSGLNPWQIPLLALQSPRAVGEMAVGIGSGARRIQDMASTLAQTPVVQTLAPIAGKTLDMTGALMADPMKRNLALQAGRNQRIQEENVPLSVTINRKNMQNALGAN